MRHLERPGKRRKVLTGQVLLSFILFLIDQTQTTVVVVERILACGRHKNHVLDVAKVGEEFVHQRAVPRAADGVVEDRGVDSDPRDIREADLGDQPQPGFAEGLVDVDDVDASADPETAHGVAIGSPDIGGEDEDVVLLGPVAKVAVEGSDQGLGDVHIAIKGNVVEASAVLLAFQVEDTGGISQHQLQEDHVHDLHGEESKSLHDAQWTCCEVEEICWKCSL